MPFIVVCGLPCSGKSTRSLELKKYFEETRGLRANVISDHDRGLQRNSVYSDSALEKELRSSLKSDVQRAINKDDVLILDALNYIKGYRYELYCITKSAQTPHCLVFCNTKPCEVQEWNHMRQDANQYPDDVLNGLVMRFEAPDSRNRWDSPVFTVEPGEDLPFDQIHDALFLRKPPPPNLSTLPQPVSAANFLHELDTITQSVVALILDAQKTATPGTQLSVQGATETVSLNRTLSPMELQRLRRQFVSFYKTLSVDDTSKIANMFVQFLNNRT